MSVSQAPDLAAECVRLRQAARGLSSRSIEDWRRNWSRVRDEYAASLAQNLERIADRVEMAPATLDASVKTLLSGLDPDDLTGRSRSTPEVALVILAASVPGLAAQSLFPLLASGSAVIFKPSSREPDSGRLLVEALERLDSEVAAAVSLQPDLRLGNEDVDLGVVDRVVAYGEDATLATIAGAVDNARATQLSSQGHGWSAVYLAAESITEEVLAAVARDVALFDQRGCLCPQVVLTSVPAAEVVEGLGNALARIANELPPIPDTATLGALRQLRDGVIAGGRTVSDQPLATGLVVESDSGQPVRGTPGGRSVRIYGEIPIPNAVDLLRPVAHRLQSLAAAVPSDHQRRSRSAFVSLGVRRIVQPGELHSPGFDWVARQLRNPVRS